jgi:hypothetical protein
MPVEDAVIVKRLKALLAEVDMATTTGADPKAASLTNTSPLRSAPLHLDQRTRSPA